MEQEIRGQNPDVRQSARRLRHCAEDSGLFLQHHGFGGVGQCRAKLLEQQKPLVQAYVMDQIFDKMSSGEAWLAPYYAGDAATLVADNPNIGFAIPTKEGTNFFVDAMCIPTGAKHKKEAEEYINFLCEPEVAAANMETVGYSTPESAAKKLLPKETQENRHCIPPGEHHSAFGNLREPSGRHQPAGGYALGAGENGRRGADDDADCRAGWFSACLYRHCGLQKNQAKTRTAIASLKKTGALCVKTHGGFLLFQCSTHRVR